MKSMIKYVYAGLLSFALSGCVPTGESGIIKDAPGGSVSAHQVKYYQLKSSGKSIRLEGHITSAATIFIGLPNACLAPGSTYNFHGSWPKESDPSLQRFYDMEMGKFFPPNVQRAYMAEWRHHGSISVHSIKAKDLVAMDPDYLKLCDD